MTRTTRITLEIDWNERDEPHPRDWWWAPLLSRDESAVRILRVMEDLPAGTQTTIDDFL